MGAAPSEARQPAVSEFYVHAVLQAARAYHLGYDILTAKSWGLNRAIFYEAAKKGYFRKSGGRKPKAGRGGGMMRPLGPQASSKGILYAIGREKAYGIKSRDGGLRFVMGGKPQTPEAFDRQIVKRFPSWNLVWAESLRLMESAGAPVLNSPSRFHERVYKKWRVRLAREWPRGVSVVSAALQVA